MALFIDWENIKKATAENLGALPDIITLKKIARRFGTLVTGKAYANWADSWHDGDMERVAQQGVQPVFVPTRRYVNGESTVVKDLADSQLICDAMELLAASPGVRCVVVASGDGSMQSLLEKVIATGRRAVRVAVRGSNAQRSHGLANEVVFYDDAVVGLDPKVPSARVADAVKEFARAVEDLSDKGLAHDLASVKAAILRRTPEFNEEALGIPTFRHLAYLAEMRGRVRIDASAGEPATAYPGSVVEVPTTKVPLPSGEMWARLIRAVVPGTEYTRKALADQLLAERIVGDDTEAKALVELAQRSEVLWSRKAAYFDPVRGANPYARKLLLNTHHPRIQVCLR
ncbi:MAG: NYN domain-containing protein [Vicinamibacterales bacterium]